MKFQQAFTTKWADFDPNRHMRHSAYADFAAEVRVRFFAAHGYSLNDFANLHIGPILFKEETTYFKEIKMGEDVKVTMCLEAATENYDRWRFTHQIFNENEVLAAGISCRSKSLWGMDRFDKKKTNRSTQSFHFFL